MDITVNQPCFHPKWAAFAWPPRCSGNGRIPSALMVLSSSWALERGPFPWPHHWQLRQISARFHQPFLQSGWAWRTGGKCQPARCFWKKTRCGYGCELPCHHLGSPLKKSHSQASGTRSTLGFSGHIQAPREPRVSCSPVPSYSAPRDMWGPQQPPGC